MRTKNTEFKYAHYYGEIGATLEDPVVVYLYRHNENHLKFSWKMTSWCNYHCSYCINRTETRHAPEDLEGQALRVKAVLDREKALRPGLRITMSLIGGEVGFFDLPYLLELAGGGKNFGHLFVNTNFSAPLEKWVKLDEWCRSQNIEFNIIASCHLEEADLDEFVSKFVALKNITRFKLVVNEANLEKTEEILRRLPDDADVHITIERGLRQEVKASKRLIDFKDKYHKPHPVERFLLAADGKTFTISAENSETLAQCRHGDEYGLESDGYWCTAGVDCLRLEDGKLYRSGCQWAKQNEIKSLDELPLGPYVCHTEKYCSLCYGNTVYKDPGQFKKFKSYIYSPEYYEDLMVRYMNKTPSVVAFSDKDSSMAVNASAKFSMVSKDGVITAAAESTVVPVMYVYKDDDMQAMSASLPMLVRRVRERGKGCRFIPSEKNVQFMKNTFVLTKDGVFTPSRYNIKTVPQFYENITPVWGWDEIRVSCGGLSVKKNSRRLFTLPSSMAETNIRLWKAKWEKILSKTDYIPSLSGGLDTRVLTCFWRNDSRIKRIVNRRRKRFCKSDFDGQIADKILDRIGVKPELISETPGDAAELRGNMTEWFKEKYYWKKEDFIRLIIPFLNAGLICSERTLLPFLDDYILNLSPDGLMDMLIKECCPDLMDIPYWSHNKDTKTHIWEEGTFYGPNE